MAGLTPTRTYDQPIEDFRWLADYTGMEEAESATGYAETFRPAGGHRLQNWVRSGTPVGKVTAEGEHKGKWGLYDPAATDGRQNHLGFVKAEFQLVDPVTGIENSPISFAVLRFGQINVNLLPVDFDAADGDIHFIYR